MAYNADTMSFELPDTDMIYVSGLPTDITVNDVAEHFGSIGIIKFDKKKDQKKVQCLSSFPRGLMQPAAPSQRKQDVWILCGGLTFCRHINPRCRSGCTKTRRQGRSRATAPLHMKVVG